MIMTSQTAAQTAIPASSDELIRRFGTRVHALLGYWHRRAAIKALRQLDDRALRDIGLSRCQIEAAVGGALNSGMARLQ